MSKSSKIIVALLVVILIAVLGVGGYVILKMNDKIGEQSNQIANLNGSATTSSNRNENTNNQNAAGNTENSNSEYYSNNSQNSTNNYSSNENNNTTISDELIINQEGNMVKRESEKYVSSLGYTMQYATDIYGGGFNVSYHDGGDWYEINDGSINCVVVEKENVSYSNKISTLSNYERTNVNGYEAVYTTRTAEGQFETTYYVNSGKGTVYKITTSCQNSSDYIEGLGAIMNAMVQTFSIN